MLKSPLASKMVNAFLVADLILGLLTVVLASFAVDSPLGQQ